MSTLLDMTSQGDVATISDDSKIANVQLLKPQQLYELWERQHWRTQDLDFSQDVEDWRGLSEDDRDYLAWMLSSFFIGEERVTTQFSGLVMAYEDEAEESFLTTQQVDEARHMQFFDRFYKEVLGVADDAWDERLGRVREHLNDAFVKLFDTELVQAGEALIADPSDTEAKVRFVTTYHMIIEGTLALTGQNFITSAFERDGILPGFVEGFANVSRDEHRHVAYGTWYLKKTLAERPDLKPAFQERLHELLPVAAGVLVPRGKQVGDDFELLGYTSAEVNEFAFNALNRRLKVIGVGLGDAEPAVA
ncbi:MAG: ribonucleotide-diphosphate reductase subunit beta [Solirubrobacterales bacterium]